MGGTMIVYDDSKMCIAMSEFILFANEEKKELLALCRELQQNVEEKLEPTDYLNLKKYLDGAVAQGRIVRNKFVRRWYQIFKKH